MPETTFVRSRNEDVARAAQDLPQVAQADAWIHGRKRTAKSEREEYLFNSIQEVHEQMREVGVRPVTILNSNPFPIHSTGPITENYVVPECPLGQPYIKYVISNYTTEVVADTASGWEKIKPILPLTIAKDIIQQHDKGDGLVYGGISIHMGDVDPDGANTKKEHDAAREKMEQHFRKLVNEANLEWARPDKSGRRNITDMHRQAADYLLHYRYLKERPQWTTASQKPEDVRSLCPACGSEPKKDAYQCSTCGYIVEPIRAYELGEIDAQNPAMRRLSREALKQLGISELVAETNDERKKREQKEAKAAARK